MNVLLRVGGRVDGLSFFGSRIVVVRVGVGMHSVMYALVAKYTPHTLTEITFCTAPPTYWPFTIIAYVYRRHSTYVTFKWYNVLSCSIEDIVVVGSVLALHVLV